jgi:hypothetical protein
MLNEMEMMAIRLTMTPTIELKPAKKPIVGAMKGKKTYVNVQRIDEIRIDFWKADWASAEVPSRSSGRRRSRSMNRSAEDKFSGGFVVTTIGTRR